MSKRLSSALVAVGLLAIALVAFALPASAQLRTFKVKLVDGSLITVTVDAPAGVPMSQVPGLPGTPIQELTPAPAPAPPPPPPPEKDPPADSGGDRAGGRQGGREALEPRRQGSAQHRLGSQGERSHPQARRVST